MRQINLSAIQDFIRFGMAVPGDSLFHKNATANDPEILCFINRHHKVYENIDVISKKTYQLLEESIDEIVAAKEIDSFAMSGGADSRLIFNILEKNHRSFLKSLYIYTRVHPGLGVENDRDCLIARKICGFKNIDHHVELSQIHPQFFLTSQNGQIKCPLTGLWGTELLGGSIYREKLFIKTDIIKNKCLGSPLVDYIIKSGVDENNYENIELFLHFQLLLKSKMTAFYQSVTWLFPSAAIEKSRSPFLNDKFVSFLTRLPRNLIENYNLYSRIIIDNCDELKWIPVNNVFILKELRKNLEFWGREPKLEGSFYNGPKEYLEEHRAIEQAIGSLPKQRYSSHLLSILPYFTMLE